MPETERSRPERIAELAFNGCKARDIAVIVGCSKKKLLSRYSRLISHAWAERRNWLLKQQNAAAAKGNASILTWLGKVELGQVVKKPPSAAATDSDYLAAMDLASAAHDQANCSTPDSIAE